MRHVAVGCLLSALCASPALAQLPTGKSPADSIAAELIGTWEGQFQTDHSAPGVLTLTIGRDTAWKAKIDMMAGDQSFPSRVTEFKVSGNVVSWTQDMMGMSCKGSAALAAGTLRGETVCEHASAGYVLRKK
ncbi:MAG: hypothetical protein ABJF01_11955 [bacterium]